ncbi:MAG TPA: hypothetical protein VK590_16055 [Saprospiraceae bacterium]|nr:hypothetical protein [Saprospiraceae bacterium]
MPHKKITGSNQIDKLLHFFDQVKGLGSKETKHDIFIAVNFLKKHNWNADQAIEEWQQNRRDAKKESLIRNSNPCP